MNLLDIIQLKFPEARNLIDYQIGDHGDGKQFISLWNLDVPKPTKNDLAVWEEELDLKYRQKIAVEKRVYPSLPMQLDMLYWDSINNTTVWMDTITSIKEENPKPTE